MEKCHNSVILSIRKREKSTYKKKKKTIVSESSYTFYHIDRFYSKPNSNFFFQYTVHKTKNNSRGENLTTI